jgi:nitroreductase
VNPAAPLARAELLALVDEARRAPSVHNIQPARWAALEPGVLALRADPTRTLPIADPSGHDVRVSLGAAWEGMSIALSRRGLAAGPPRLAPHRTGSRDPSRWPAAPDPTFEVRLSFERGGATDPLVEAVARRAAFRGTFASTPDSMLDGLERRLAPSGLVAVRDRRRIRELAALADDASAEFVASPGYWRETWQWLRLSAAHPDWGRDGLNADALALSGMERAAAGWLMAPAPFEWMRRLGLARALLSEFAKTASAGALLLVTAPTEEDPFITGRAFYRRWLEVTASGLALCPMSVLADSKRANAEIRRLYSLPDGTRLVNVFRVGSAAAGFPRCLTPRLPAEELIVSTSA